MTYHCRECFDAMLAVGLLGPVLAIFQTSDFTSNDDEVRNIVDGARALTVLSCKFATSH